MRPCRIPAVSNMLQQLFQQKWCGMAAATKMMAVARHNLNSLHFAVIHPFPFPLILPTLTPQPHFLPGANMMAQDMSRSCSRDLSTAWWSPSWCCWYL